jgi:hypothetical protein
MSWSVGGGAGAGLLIFGGSAAAPSTTAESRDKDASISTRRGINERSSTRSDEIYAIRVNGGFPRKVDE